MILYDFKYMIFWNLKIIMCLIWMKFNYGFIDIFFIKVILFLENKIVYRNFFECDYVNISDEW